MSDTEVESLNTMLPLTVPEIIDIIKDSATECSKSKDYISFSTVLDVYLDDWSIYNAEERTQLMDTLYEVLEADKQLLAEIGWDLPPLLLPLIEDGWPVKFGLRESFPVVWLYKMFNLLTENGDPKALLLTCCEQIKILKDTDQDEPVDPVLFEEIKNSLSEEYKSKFDDVDQRIANYITIKRGGFLVIKFHALFECIKFSLRKIDTLYPSKFLGMVVSTILNFFNNAKSSSGEISILRAVYLFMRDYVPPDIPKGIVEREELSEEEFEKIFGDENYLQRKLLCFLLGACVDRMSQSHPVPLIIALMPSLIDYEMSSAAKNYVELLNRLVTLQLSFDIDVEHQLMTEIQDCHGLLIKNIENVNTAEDMVKVVISTYNNTSFRDKKPTGLTLTNSSLIILYMFAGYVDHVNSTIQAPLDTLSLIALQLFMFIPYTVDTSLTNLAAFSYLLVMTILNIEKTKQVASASQLANKRIRLLVLTYLQTVTSVVSLCGLKNIRKLFSKFLNKFLQHLPEDISYSFILDTLENCPFDDSVVCVLTVYKHLVSAVKFDGEKFVQNFEALDLKEKTYPKPPSLPPRNLVDYKPFIEFTEFRQKEFTNTFGKVISETFPSTPLGIDVLKTGKLVAFINFVIKADFKDKDEIKSLLKRINGFIVKVDSKNTAGVQYFVDKINFAVDEVLRKI